MRNWIIVVALLVAPAPALTLSATPDVFVATIAVTHEQKELVAHGFGDGYMFGGYATARVQTYRTGTVIVDLYDAWTKQLVWRGTGTDTLSDKPERTPQR